jgi:hypothetical protein
MEKILLLTLLLLLVCPPDAKSQYPIPSYNTPVNYRANFEEKKYGISQENSSREKRKVIVRTVCGSAGITSCTALVWVYSLDGQTIYGPFIVNPGTDLIVDIDDRLWGVYVESDDPIIVDVWIE